MKNMKKITSILCLLLMAVVFTFTGTNSVKAAVPTSATISHSGASPKYIGDVDIYFLEFNDGTTVYCYDGTDTAWPAEGTAYTLDGEASAAIKYILEHGSSTHANSSVAQYITQGAIWWYRAEYEGGNQLNEDFTSTGAESITGIRDKIIALVNEAKNASSSNSNTKAYIFRPNGSQQRVVALYTEDTPEPTPDKECVNVEYKIVGDVIPDPAKTDPTPDKVECLDKGTEYDQEKELTTRQPNCKFNGWYTNSNLTGRWTNGTALNNDLILYGAWDCGTPVKVPATAANTPLVILGVGLVIIAAGVGVYIYRDKKLSSNK